MTRGLRTPAIIRPEHAFAYNEARGVQEWEGDDGDQLNPYWRENIALAKRIWEVLQFHYPGHYWVTGANHEQGIVRIEFPMFTMWPYILKIADLKADPGMKQVVDAGGEILERYRIPRSGFTVANLVAAQNMWKPRWTSRLKPPE